MTKGSRKLDHLEFKLLIADHLNGTLDPIREGRFMRHVERCRNGCDAMFAAVRADRVRILGDGSIGAVGRAYERGNGRCLEWATITERLQGRLTPDEAKVVDMHLFACASCSQTFHSYKAVRQRAGKDATAFLPYGP